ncbi:hypothetical protein LEP1GSC193_3654 [Leptospira alstonii serovar Pingchang str. 80-412]|uniref:Uncharacterized protein n=2 Tax=Leptospira alstonii TaxID=28452 RepID=M6CLP3_9LEPT|nr:hypothetical protein LEP1GSC194_3414 [Leptospira alstonii serovar Sichuan str. 79601]EQA81290.1 hypothetical protein LEP1GSC193_3654 [Leptospira alstonii serovar Pingchang str. 80-412]
MDSPKFSTVEFALNGKFSRSLIKHPYRTELRESGLTLEPGLRFQKYSLTSIATAILLSFYNIPFSYNSGLETSLQIFIHSTLFLPNSFFQ